MYYTKKNDRMPLNHIRMQPPESREKEGDFMRKTIKTLAVLLALVMILVSFSGCGDKGTSSIGNDGQKNPGTDNTAAGQDGDNASSEDKTYPYTDDEGHIRYQFMLNGVLADIPHEPFSVPGAKGAFFPLEDVLNLLGVAVVKTDDGTAVGSSINGNIFKASNGEPKMCYGNKSIKAANSSSYPMMKDGVLYVPSFFFMQLSDNSIVDFSKDGCCTLDTDVVIDANTSGPIGITADDLKPDAAKVNTNGNANHNACRSCFGTGRQIEVYTNSIGYNGQLTATPVRMTRSVPCTRCAGTGIEP